ncbi:MAG: lipopolysaccharide assembly protein LapA domain-containing protein [Nocardioides sp.]|nr:lipopolysaccharide assembly protein LapA domain-containing protein [Nocardioides sp.]
MTSPQSEPTPDHAEPATPTPTSPTSSSPERATPSKGERRAHDPLRASRTSGFYTAVIGLGVVLVLLIIFIVQNTEPSSIEFLVWEGTAPQAVLLLIATAAGIFLTATASSLRLLQVRRRVKRERKG